MRGFTIIEVAMALFLITLLFGSVFIPLQSRVDIRNVTLTERRLKEARDAVIAYAAAKGYFPCPASASSVGQEAAGTDHATGVCGAYFGYLPAATLGLQATDAQGFAIDAWAGPGNRIRYAVADHAVGPTANSNAFTRVNGMRTAGIAVLGNPALSLLHVCESARGIVAGRNCGTVDTIVSTTPAVIWSVGPNAASGGMSADEAQNPNPNGGTPDRIFVMHPRSAAVGNEFDDILTWIPMTHLVRAMLAAGHLP